MMRHSGVVLLLALVLIVAACGKTRHKTDVDVPQSGFLGEYYAKLTPGDESKYETSLKWHGPDYDLTKYDKAMLDPILIYRAPEEGITREDAQLIADYFYEKLHTAMSDGFKMTRQPGPKTLRLTVALTNMEARGSVVLDTVSNLDMMARTATEMGAVVTGRPLFTGAAVVEVKVADAHSGKVIAAEIDQRVGGKSLFKGFSEWSDVFNAIDYWADLTKYRVCLLQKRAGCETPSAM